MRACFALVGLIASVFAPAVAAATEPTCQLEKVAEMPVTMSGLRALVPIKINGVDGKLVIDSGAFFSLLGPASAARFGLKAGALPLGLNVRGVTGEADVRFTTAKDFNILGAPFHNADFLVGEHQFGAQADGLLGANLLTAMDVEYDFADGVIRFFHEKGCGSTPPVYWARPEDVAKLDIDRVTPLADHLHGSATVNGAHIRVEFDSGASRSVLDLSGAGRAGIKTSSPGVVKAGMSAGVGRQIVQDYIAPIDSFVIGGEQVKASHLRVADIQLDDVDMLLGADFFLSHRIFVSTAQSRIFFTYNGGPVFDLGEPTARDATQGGAGPSPVPSSARAVASEEPVDAAGYIRRGQAFASRREFEEAIADYTRAVGMAPTDSAPLFFRAQAKLENHQPLKALDDLNQALTLKPNDVAALMLRAQLRLAVKDQTGAKTDLDAAVAADPGLQVRAANAFLRGGMFQDAITNFDAWIAAHPKDPEIAAPIAGRCAARAFLGQGLDQAMADCNQALKLAPGAPEILASRGIAELRLGQYDKTISDEDATLKALPHNAWALEARGLAKQKRGDTAGGAADLAAAVAIQPTIADQAKNRGIAP